MTVYSSGGFHSFPWIMFWQGKGSGIVSSEDSLKRCDIHLVQLNAVTDEPVRHGIVIKITKKPDFPGVMGWLVKLPAGSFHVALPVGKA